MHLHSLQKLQVCQFVSLWDIASVYGPLLDIFCLFGKVCGCQKVYLSRLGFKNTWAKYIALLHFLKNLSHSQDFNASRKWSYSSRSSYYLVGKRTQAPEPTTPGFAVKPTAGLLQLKCKQRSAFRHLTSSSTFYFIRTLVLCFFLGC